MQMKCGELYINWKPEPIKYLMNFFFKRGEETKIKNFIQQLKQDEIQEEQYQHQQH